jgi:hypothetical protein
LVSIKLMAIGVTGIKPVIWVPLAGCRQSQGNRHKARHTEFPHRVGAAEPKLTLPTNAVSWEIGSGGWVG